MEISLEHINLVKKQLKSAFESNSEQHLLKILKDNPFLFYELHPRKFSVEPIFAEVPLGTKLRCDFAWLNDNSDGPEWVLVEVEKPAVRLFNKNGDTSADLNHAIEQVRSWKRFFEQNPYQKREIFGYVSRFRFVLVVGTKEDWQSKNALLWRESFNKENNIGIRSMDVFWRALEIAYKDLESQTDTLWAFKQQPHCQNPSQLQTYWESNPYIQKFRQLY